MNCFKNLIKSATVVTLALVFALSLLSAAPASAKTILKIQSAYPHGDISMDALKAFADSAAKNSGGNLEVKVFAEPEIVPGDQLFGATKRNVVNMLHACGLYWSGMIPVANMEFGLPGAFNLKEENFKKQAQIVRDFFYKSGFLDLLRAEYAKQGMYLLDIHTYGPAPFTVATKPLKTLADMQGVKIKTEGINAMYFAGVGMQGANISGMETYMSLKTGVVDAAEWDVSAVTGLKWYEVAPYWIRGPENDQAIGHILVNMKKWEGLSDADKKALMQAGEDYWTATVEAYNEQMENVKDLIAKGTLKVVDVDDEAMAKFQETADKIWSDAAKESDASAKALEMIKKWRAGM